MPRRTAGAPRLIEASGERIVPWAHDAQVIYEHLHRYLWARPLVAGRRVLDAGSGEGYGAALLAEVACTVTGIDVDERAVAHSRVNYVAANLGFDVASATDLSAFDDDSFGAVVAFEMIEHVAEHEAVLAEIARVLAPGGLLVMSTPERQAYSDERDFVNPYHERELTQEEFTALLRSRFANVLLFSQAAIAGSRLDALGTAAEGHLSLPVERAGGEWREAGPARPFYLVALASDAELPTVVAGSTLFDRGLEVIVEYRATIETLVEDRRAREEQILAELTEKNDLLVAEQSRAQRAEDQARRVTESVSWQALERIRAAIGETSWLGRRLRAITRRIFAARRSARH